MDRQFLSSRRHQPPPPPPPPPPRPKIQFEKSNNAAQFARKCASRPSSGGHCSPGGHNAPDWRGIPFSPSPRAATIVVPDGFLQRPRLFSATATATAAAAAAAALPYARTFCLLAALFSARTTVWPHACRI